MIKIFPFFSLIKIYVTKSSQKTKIAQHVVATSRGRHQPAWPAPAVAGKLKLCSTEDASLVRFLHPDLLLLILAAILLPVDHFLPVILAAFSPLGR